MTAASNQPLDPCLMVNNWGKLWFKEYKNEKNASDFFPSLCYYYDQTWVQNFTIDQWSSHKLLSSGKALIIIIFASSRR